MPALKRFFIREAAGPFRRGAAADAGGGAVTAEPLAFARSIAFEDQPLGLLGIAPADDLDPLAGLEILVVLEEVLDLLERDVGQVGVALDALVALRQLAATARR